MHGEPTRRWRMGNVLRRVSATWWRLAVHPRTSDLFGVQHGRDMLFENWPQFFTVEEDAVLPAEEFVRITRGSDNGWPYCYFDAVTENKKVLAPEYGGNGQLVSGNGIDCASYNQPLVTFGAHWAPNGLHFYSGNQFPARYRNGAFVAFHGGFDRAPLPNEGYQVVFVPVRRQRTADGQCRDVCRWLCRSTHATAGKREASAGRRDRRSGWLALCVRRSWRPHLADYLRRDLRGGNGRARATTTSTSTITGSQPFRSID